MSTSIGLIPENETPKKETQRQRFDPRTRAANAKTRGGKTGTGTETEPRKRRKPRKTNGSQPRSTEDEMTQEEKERIEEQSMRMFVTQGIKAVRMDDIAQQLSVSKRTLYELFGDKEELLYRAMVRYFERNRKRWEELGQETPNVLERLFLVLNDVMESSETTRRLLENLQKFYPAIYRKLMVEGSARNRQGFREMLEQGISEGLFIDNIDMELAITVLYYTASAITTRRDMILPEGMTERHAFTQIVSTFFRGISTAKGLEIIDDFLKKHCPKQRKQRKTTR